MKLTLLLTLLLTFSVSAIGEESHPDCSGINHWPTNMAFGSLKNMGVTNNEKLDFTKTVTKRIASEKVGNDLYRQVHYITFTEKSGQVIQVITVNDVSHEECSMGGVKVYVISHRLK